MVNESVNISSLKFWSLRLLKTGGAVCLYFILLIIWKINVFMTVKRNRYTALKAHKDTRQRRRLSISSSALPEATTDQDGEISPTAHGSNSLYSWVYTLLRPKVRGSSTHPQHQCGFFRLPPEVRLEIYRYFLPIERVHIIPLSGKLSCVACPVDRGDGQKCYCIDNAAVYKLTGTMCVSTPDMGVPVDLRNGTKTGLTGVSGLLQACRKIYTEVVDILYTEPTFHTEQPIALMGLSASIPAHRLRTITKLDLDSPIEGVNSWSSDYRTYVPAFMKLGWDPEQLRPSLSKVVAALIGNSDTPGVRFEPSPSALACVRVLSWMTGLRQLRVITDYWRHWEIAKEQSVGFLLAVHALQLPNLLVCEVSGRGVGPHLDRTTLLRLEDAPLRLVKRVGSEWIDEQVL